jgi:hypothetical protein
MKPYYHYLYGVLWIIVCILLGLYIRGRGINSRKQYTLGFKAIVLSYLFGLCLLFLAIALS